MKRVLIVALALTTCLFATQALALDEARPYFTLGGGATQLTEAGITEAGVDARISSQIGYNGLIAAGLAWDVGRLEFSAGYNDQKFDELHVGGATAALDGNVSMYNLLASVFYDFNKDGKMSPYFGGGIGAARLDIKSADLAGNDAFTFAYQLGVGLTLNTSKDFVIDVGYRLLGTNKLDFGETKADYFLFHNANLGLRWLF